VRAGDEAVGGGGARRRRRGRAEQSSSSCFQRRHVTVGLWRCLLARRAASSCLWPSAIPDPSCSWLAHRPGVSPPSSIAAACAARVVCGAEAEAGGAPLDTTPVATTRVGREAALCC
jgi:hypothetical protein